MSNSKNTKQNVVELEFQDGSTLKGTLTYIRCLSKEKNKHKFSIALGELKETFSLEHPDIMIGLHLRKLCREYQGEWKGKNFRYLRILHPLSRKELERRICNTHRTLEGGLGISKFGSNVKTVKDEYNAVLDILKISMANNNETADPKDIKDIIDFLTKRQIVYLDTL